jgi:Flp pilus assembly protein TadB
MSFVLRATERAELGRARELLAGFHTDSPELSGTSGDESPARNSLHQRFNTLCVQAAVGKADQHSLLLVGLLLASLPILLAIVLKLPILALLALLVPLVQWQVLVRKAFRRAESFERDYTAFLLSLASGVRTGLDPLVAFSQAYLLFPASSVMGEELRGVKEKIERGETEEDAIRSFGASIAHPDIHLFQTALILARREGSSLSECLQRLAKVTRQRQSFRRKIQGATAMQRLSTYGILACAALIGLMQFSSNPGAMLQALQHPLGFKAVVVGSLLLGIGVAMMLNLTKRRI